MLPRTAVAVAAALLCSPTAAHAQEITSGADNPLALTPFRDGIVYHAEGGPDGRAVYFSTPKATTKLLDVYGVPTSFGVLGEHAYFGASTAAGVAVYRTDGTTVTAVKTMQPKKLLSVPASFTRVGDRLFFAGADADVGRRLFVTDGSEAGTVAVSPQFGNGPSILGRLGCSLVFFAGSGSFGGELWISDGTLAGTRALTSGGVLRSTNWAASLPGKLLFRASTTSHGSELWVTDGTPAGTQLVKDIRPGTEGSEVPINYGPQTATLGGRVYFLADDGTHGIELWSSDGTEGGTKLVIDLDPGTGASGPRSGAAGPIVASTKHVYFFGAFPSLGDVGQRYRAIVRTDGTVAGTEMMSDGVEAVTSQEKANPQDTVRFGGLSRGMVYTNGRVYVSTYTAKHGTEVYELPATPGPARVLVDTPKGGASSNAELLVAGVDTLFWSANAVVLGAFRPFAKTVSSPCGCSWPSTCPQSTCVPPDGACGSGASPADGGAAGDPSDGGTGGGAAPGGDGAAPGSDDEPPAAPRAEGASGDAGGCACSTATRATPSAWGLLAVLPAAARRRRR